MHCLEFGGRGGGGVEGDDAAAAAVEGAEAVEEESVVVAVDGDGDKGEVGGADGFGECEEGVEVGTGGAEGGGGREGVFFLGIGVLEEMMEELGR